MKDRNDDTWKKIPLAEINADKWDHCIAAMRAPVFSELWYWQAVIPVFQTWVKGDYEEVLALPISRKWGIIPTMRMPLYVKWLVGNERKIAQHIRQFFGWKKVFVAFGSLKDPMHQFQALTLTADWSPSKELRKKIRKCEEAQYKIEEATWHDFFLMMRDHHPYAWPLVQQQALRRLFDAASSRGKGRIVGVKKDNQWLAMQFLVESRDQVSLVQNVSDPAFRNDDPMSFLLCSVFEAMKSESAKKLINFMGSDHPGVAQYNRKFGAEDRCYWEG